MAKLLEEMILHSESYDAYNVHDDEVDVAEDICEQLLVRNTFADHSSWDFRRNLTTRQQMRMVHAYGALNTMMRYGVHDEHLPWSLTSVDIAQLTKVKAFINDCRQLVSYTIINLVRGAARRARSGGNEWVMQLGLDRVKQILNRWRIRGSACEFDINLELSSHGSDGNSSEENDATADLRQVHLEELQKFLTAIQIDFKLTSIRASSVIRALGDEMDPLWKEARNDDGRASPSGAPVCATMKMLQLDTASSRTARCVDHRMSGMVHPVHITHIHWSISQAMGSMRLSWLILPSQATIPCASPLMRDRRRILLYKIVDDTSGKGLGIRPAAANTNGQHPGVSLSSPLMYLNRLGNGRSAPAGNNASELEMAKLILFAETDKLDVITSDIALNHILGVCNSSDDSPDGVRLRTYVFEAFFTLKAVRNLGQRIMSALREIKTEYLVSSTYRTRPYYVQLYSVLGGRTDAYSFEEYCEDHRLVK